MLLRQLHRPLLRSITAAWRPVATAPTAPPPPTFCNHQLGHGDNRGNSSNSSSNTDTSTSSSTESADSSHGDNNDHPVPDNDQHSEAEAIPPPTAAASSKPSLFDRLFPNDVKKSQQGGQRTGAPVYDFRLLHGEDEDEPPRLEVPEELRDGGEDSGGAQDDMSDMSAFVSSALGAEAMLILSAASKNLLESDFLRLGSKGKHVEGWVGGIVKVIQARDPDTLEPHGHYFILFDTHEAAVAYKDRLEQLWGLGKAYVPGAHHARSHLRQQQPLPRGLRRTEQGEDVADLIRSFTLVPPGQGRHVQLSSMDPSRITELYLAGGFVEQLAARAGSRFLVLVRPDGGRLTLDALRRAITDDGIRRNLAWRVVDLDHGIMPFGKSMLKAKDYSQAYAQAQAQAQADGKAREGVTEGGDDSGEQNAPANFVYDGESAERFRQYPRFIVPFTDRAEAHRFVQNWHRREMRLQMGGGGPGQPSWEEDRIINATMLW